MNLIENKLKKLLGVYSISKNNGFMLDLLFTTILYLSNKYYPCSGEEFKSPLNICHVSLAPDFNPLKYVLLNQA